MLAYLDALIAALVIRDGPEIGRLLAHPLARVLSDAARSEAQAIAVGERDPLSAPLRVMQLRHQTAELLRETPSIADQPEPALRDDDAVSVVRDPARAAAPSAPRSTRAPARLAQMELPLSA